MTDLKRLPYCRIFFSILTSLGFSSCGMKIIGGDFLAALSAISSSSSGSLDTSFGVSGKAAIAAAANNDSGYNLIRVQSDGSILCSGSTFVPGPKAAVSLIRLRPDGSIDPTFNGGVILKVALTTNHFFAYAIEVQSDGKILVGGKSQDALNNYDIVIVRLNSDGTTDTTFGVSGVVTIDSGNVYDAISGLVVQSDGKILGSAKWGVGGVGNIGAVIRLNSDGTFDPTFGVSGVVQIPNTTGARAIVLQIDGKIVVSGIAGSQAFIARLSSVDGSLDATNFNSAGPQPGVQFLPPLTNSAVVVQSAAIQADGKIIIAGIDENVGVTGVIYVARVTATGIPDPTFNGSGALNIDLPSMTDENIKTVKALSDGKVLLLGDDHKGSFGTGDPGFLIRLQSNGNFDSTFFSGGIYSFWSDGNGSTRVGNLELTSDGKYLIGGCEFGGDVSVLRINP